LYGYVNENPLTWTDPYGLGGISTGFSFGGSFGGIGGTISINGYFNHDPSQSWMSGWSSGTGVSVMGGGAIGISENGQEPISWGSSVDFSYNTACNVSQINGPGWSGSRNGLFGTGLYGYGGNGYTGTGVAFGIGPGDGSTIAGGGPSRTAMYGGNW
jgi:hypothetical protein